MSEIDREGLNKLKERAFVLSAAFNNRRASFALPNMLTIVIPAALSTIAAVTGHTDLNWFDIDSIQGESVLAGLAAILITLHKVLNCEAYQAECLRLSNLFKSIAQDAEIAILSSRELSAELYRLSKKLTTVIENANATVPNRYMVNARKTASDENYALVQQ